MSEATAAPGSVVTPSGIKIGVGTTDDPLVLDENGCVVLCGVGAALNNPVLVDDDGRDVVTAADQPPLNPNLSTRSQLGRGVHVLHVYQSSEVRRRPDLNPLGGNAVRPPPPLRPPRWAASTSTRAARVSANAAPIRRVVPAAAPARILRGGNRDRRNPPLEADALYAMNICPDLQPAKWPHYKCGICQYAKSHPVVTSCGHSYCYVCIRLWFERSWKCPHCRETSISTPLRNYDYEAAITQDHPEWNDQSVVTYSWAGLQFPYVPNGA
ncbi:hypothetical protein B0H16DRAFT_1744926 [Mycena metata]|uniref:RING-type domain-containing protein n=1 Tax=Mycena metata TaxID=1033252 RepID=A0AAD7H4I0_9AGAR|nr:hypothetical protein B0H16DRAFT_1744926 [Mycena metata]